jgi:hypothetical protein
VPTLPLPVEARAALPPTPTVGSWSARRTS